MIIEIDCYKCKDRKFNIETGEHCRNTCKKMENYLDKRERARKKSRADSIVASHMIDVRLDTIEGWR